MILLENSEAQRRHYEHKCEDMAQRLRETERLLQAAQKEINSYQVSWSGHARLSAAMALVVEALIYSMVVTEAILVESLLE